MPKFHKHCEDCGYVFTEKECPRCLAEDEGLCPVCMDNITSDGGPCCMECSKELKDSEED